jgi:glycosyltransferase involved in cell wall biosynthesis
LETEALLRKSVQSVVAAVRIDPSRVLHKLRREASLEGPGGALPSPRDDGMAQVPGAIETDARQHASVRVAVVIPCFNDGATVGEAVESLRLEEPCEVVIVDDGSTDAGTLEELRRLSSAGVTVVSQENQGLSAARMRGVAATSAPYILYVDADDRIMPGAIARLADVLDENPRAGAAWGDLRLFGEVELRQRRAQTLDPWLITYVNRLGHGAIRRSALEAAGGWVLKVGYEDWDLWMSLAECGWDGIGVDAEIYCYRVSSSRMLSNAQSQHEQLYSRMRERHPQLYARRRRNWWRSRAPLRMRLLFPLVARLPLSPGVQHRLSMAIAEPIHSARAQLSRRRQRR